MRTRSILGTLTLLLVVAGVGMAADNPLIGTWKLNESKSTYAPGSDKNITVTYTAAQGNMLTCTTDGVDKNGKPIHWTWTGSLDGKRYPLKGSPEFDTLSYHSMDERTNETTAWKNGKVVMTAMIAVAKDGKSRTVTLIGTDAKGKQFTNKTYYDRQ